MNTRAALRYGTGSRSAALAVLLLLLLLASYPLRRADLLPHLPMTEDGFYLLTVARNIAHGHGISYDGVLPTNGVQALAAFLYAPAYLVFPRDQFVAPLRVAMVIQLALFIGGAFLCAATSGALAAPQWRTSARRLGFLLWLGSFPVFRHAVNGLETGLYLLLLACFLNWLVLHDPRRHGWGRTAATGLFLGVLVLARVDAVILVVAVAVCYLTWWGQPGAIWMRAARATLAAGAALAVSSPWWIRSWRLFGSLMPTSGQAQATNISPLINGERIVSALAQPLSPVLLPVGLRFRWIPAVLWLVLLIAGWSGLAKLARSAPGEDRLHAAWPALLPFAIAGVGWAAFYGLRFGAPQFTERYLIPLAVAVIPVTAVVLARAAVASDARPALRRALAAGGAAVFALVVCEHAMALAGASALSRNWHYLGQYRALASALPSDVVVGAAQSGTLGYYRAGTVNLDGKVNADAMAAIGRGELWRYVAQSRIAVLIDWPRWIGRLLGPCRTTRYWTKTGEAAGFEVWRRSEAAVTARSALDQACTRPGPSASPAARLTP